MIIPRKELPAGTILRENSCVRVTGFSKLPENNRNSLHLIIKAYGLEPHIIYDGEDIEFPDCGLPLGKVGRAVKYGDLDLNTLRSRASRKRIKFAEIDEKSKEYAKKLSRDYKKIRDALRSYETDKVVIDEIERATTLLRSLHKNKEYFEFFAPPIASFLPLNQPLYSFICFGVVPALMCTEVHLRPPKFSHTAFRSILQVIDAEEWFHNLHISFEDRNSFVEKTKKNVEGVIFVGSSENVRRVRRKYSNDILFLANGSGHNPVIIGKSANLRLALQRSFEVVLYNQGQDCCAPNTILVDAELCHEFVDKLLAKLLSIEDYVGRSEDDHNIVGHNTSRPHTVKVARMFEELAKFHIYGGDINPITGLIKPTVFLRSLSEGANYTEFFAPIFYIQPYHGMDELRDYFFSKKYRPNAMYVTVFGDCPLIPELLEAGLHDSSNVIYDSNLLIEEEGTKPFGGDWVGMLRVYTIGETPNLVRFCHNENCTPILFGTISWENDN